ncbi:sigma-54-dependent transcriptional regulator [Silvibacterium acidisoli]|uniref:sigma-54-dependent transcriptional regulator n=1 Tax=Acidobacteriaceae bacterium ZG23-2 TaxID=2883246 RepID=UPI00406C9336
MTTYHPASERSGRLHVLVVDEDSAVRSACSEIAVSLGFVSHQLDNPSAARELLRSNSIDILLLDLKPSSPVGLELLEEVRMLHPDIAVIVMTAYATVTSAVEAMRTGAADFLEKPFSVEELSHTLVWAADRRTVDASNRELREMLRNRQGLRQIIGSSPEMEKLYRILSKVAQTAHPVLILGESGTGKELVARTIHSSGPNAHKSFLPIDCGSLMSSLVESELFGYAEGAFPGANRAKLGVLASAGGGTVFLDEIAEMPLDLQGRLLRALQEKQVRPLGALESVPINVRIVAATSRDLAAMVAQGKFRKDLYYRLNVVSLRIPPLRDRREDIPLLVKHFLDAAGRKDNATYTLSDNALRTLTSYTWPGNVRELENAVERACSMSSGPMLHAGDLPTQLQNFHLEIHREELPAVDTEAVEKNAVIPLADLERQAILDTLRVLKGDKLTAARMLGIGKTTLYRKLKEYGIESAVRA